MSKAEKIIEASIQVHQEILTNKNLLSEIELIADLITNALKNGNRIYFCGNGGSAADAQHLSG
jgi:D-sedoheptulose 7-phosphate isomerase